MYATSLALREAGAEQAGAERLWCVHPSTEAVELVSPGALFYRGGVRAWRLDEILEEMRKLLPAPKRIQLNVFFDGSAIVGRFPRLPDFTGSSPVEAAAACYLAILATLAARSGR